MIFETKPPTNNLVVVKFLKTSVDWVRYFRLVSAIGNSLNSHKNRFDKSDLLEQSLETYSLGKIKWINSKGCDHLLNDGTRMEMKYIEGALIGDTGRTRKIVSSIKLMNSLGTCSHQSLPPDYADYLLLSDKNAIAVIDKTSLCRYIEVTGDGICAKSIPINEFSIIIKQSVVPFVELEFDYVQAKTEMQKRFIEQIL